MKHHLDRAKHVYSERGIKDLVRTSLSYIPIELNNMIFKIQYGQGTKIMEEDWDQLVLLDACRYDMFKDRIDLDGTLEWRISRGSTSEEFLDQNFGDGEFHDTVYINTNPYLPKLNLDDRTFHTVIDLLDEWDPELQTVHPETVVKAGKKAAEKYPNKRIIIHFMQPHVPFIGDKGKRISAEGWTLGQESTDSSSQTVWQQLRHQSGQEELSEETVISAYYENLEIVLEYVSEMLGSFRGKTVLSADHGNLVGERLRPIPTKKMYGHYYGVYTTELVKVPWFIIDSEERREIESEPPIKNTSVKDKKIETRLQALGYR